MDWKLLAVRLESADWDTIEWHEGKNTARVNCWHGILKPKAPDVDPLAGSLRKKFKDWVTMNVRAPREWAQPFLDPADTAPLGLIEL
jgi:hypothetical protein